jgi:hypothetical protein
MGTGVPSNYAAVLIKAMLVHGASWGPAAAIIEEAIGKNYIDRFVGYGIPDFERVKECAKSRVTLIGFGDIRKNNGFIFELPLPFAFNMNNIERKLTVTLAYLTSISPNTSSYRNAKITFNLLQDNNLVANTENSSVYDSQRGTLQHQIFYNNDINTWNPDTPLQVKVSCRENINTKLKRDDTIPYALFATFEILNQPNIDVYQAVKDRIDIQVRQPVPIGTH